VGSQATSTAAGIGATPHLSIGVQANASDLPIPGTYFNGSIANFRLYSKALNAGQIQELYDYQKDYFLGSKSQVTLYKGHLGVGVTEPSGQLELAGDERLQEYPPRALTGYETLIPGHGVFCASASVDSSPNYYPGGVFDKTANIFYWEPGSGGSRYSTSSPGNYLQSNRLAAETALGEYLVLKLPYKIKLDSFSIARQNGGWWVPQEIIYYAKCEEEDLWEQIHSHGSIMGSYANGAASSDGTNNPIHREVKSTKFYRYFALVITKSNGGAGTSLNEWRLFGTPGPTTLDKGSLSLGRSLDVPRISRYDVDTETPRYEKLLIDLDTTVGDTGRGAIDISGQGNHGTFNGGAYYSAADKAFNFDGTDDYIEAVTNLGSGNQTLCFSMWLKPETDGRWFIDLGKNTATGGSFFAIRYSTYYQFNVKNGNYLQITAGSLNTWEHLVIIHHGTGSTKTAGTIEGYVNGVPGNIIASDFADDQLSLSANPPIEIGARTGESNAYFDGKISNFKLYNVALEPSEVQKLYRLGRTGRSMVISDTAVGIGKVPEAQLDVRGSGGFTGGVKVGGNSKFYDSGTNLALSLSGKAGTAGTTYGWVTLDPNDLSGTAETTGVSIWDALHVQGTFTATTGKGFLIDHPNNPKNKKLFHTAIEAPRLDLIYRGVIELTEGRATVNIDNDCVGNPECAMENGTFESLCRDPVYYLQNTSDFDRVIATVEGGMLKIVCENPQSTSVINWMVIAERKDREAINANITNSSGRVITEIVDTSIRVEKDGTPIYPVQSDETSNVESQST
jgi:hypothetical protein